MGTLILMEVMEAKKRLQEVIYERYVESEEYQDKYYLKKQIQMLFPYLAEPNICTAIDTANALVSPPRKKEEFINILAGQLFPQCYTK